MAGLNFLSDLCGREELLSPKKRRNVFLSDLCGREEMSKEEAFFYVFLSDLCGREGVNTGGIKDLGISKRPVRS